MWTAIDFYNYCVTGDVTRTLTGSRVDTKNLPCVMITNDIEREYIVVQDKTGTLSPGAHAGSYNGQDAYNGMLVNAEDRRVQRIESSVSTKAERLQGRNGFSEGGGRKMKRVRRLTPLECERLQGFPDNWTDIGDWTDTKGKVHKSSDSARYKALGNSIATPYWFVLMRRISAQYERPATLGSLFSGIGGFEYCWARCNGVDTCVWSSEIEEFPIAVTKKHFGDGDLKGDFYEVI